jgi:ATP:corrinoid adenosyltransferase
MSSLYRDFAALIPGDPLTVALVVAHNGDGTSTVEFPNGSQLKVLGQGVAVSSYAFIKGGEIRSEAPAVTPVELLV